MILIADSGGTKTQWTLMDGQQEILSVKTPGLHPYFLNSIEMIEILDDKLLPKLGEHKVRKIFFYGAGCSKEEKQEIIYATLRHIFPQSEIEVKSDLLGAARSVLGHSSGIAGILGTGSNVAYYDGTQLTHEIQSTGYLIGDEGSGAYLGKLLLRDFFYDRLPGDLHKYFTLRYGSNKRKILNPLYDSDFPNRYLARFTFYLKDNIAHPHIRSLVKEGFRDYFKWLVSQIDANDKNIAFVGSVAYVFRELLEEVAVEQDYNILKIIKEPVSGLIDFHINPPL